MENIHGDNLALFQNPEVHVGSQKTEWLIYRPINQLTEGAAIEFNVPGTSTSYIDLANTLLHVNFNIVKANGEVLEVNEKVGVTNNILHSMFSQIDLHIQQHPTSEVGNNYAYKAYLDTLLGTPTKHDLDCIGFIKDDNDWPDDTDPSGGNTGLYMRSFWTVQSKTVDVIGHLQVDMCQQDRLLLNGAPVNVKLWQSKDPFRLAAAPDTEAYKLVIRDAALKVAMVKVDPELIIGQAKTLKNSEALYPYTRSVVKTFAVPSGQYSFITDDLFQGEVPRQLIVGLVSSSAIHGKYTKNPFNFQHFNCNYVGFFVDGQSTPSSPLQPNYNSDTYVDAFKRLYSDRIQRVTHLTRRDFKSGSCLYVFNPEGDLNDRSSQRAHTRLELKFSEGLPETCTVIVYAKFPALLKIDASRNVTLES